MTTNLIPDDTCQNQNHDSNDDECKNQDQDQNQNQDEDDDDDDEVQETIRTVATSLPPSAVIVDGDSERYYRHIFLGNRSMLDVRSTIEFNKGAFPNSVNFPLLNDEYRKLVGTRYKQDGKDAAIALGAELVSGDIKVAIIENWKAHVIAHPDSYLYCFRGGLRSKISQTWITNAINKSSNTNTNKLQPPPPEGPSDASDASESPPPPPPSALPLLNPPQIIAGGYKAMRNYLMREIERSVLQFPIVMVAGRSATGKTHLLKRLTRYIDLEGLANHRGSAFGSVVEQQPSQINFENTLAIEFLKLADTDDDSNDNNNNDSNDNNNNDSNDNNNDSNDNNNDSNDNNNEDGSTRCRRRRRRRRPIFIEDEGPRIGAIFVPGVLKKAMQERYPLVVIETPFSERVKTCVEDYVTHLVPEFIHEYGTVEGGLVKYREWFLASLLCVKKKLGGPLHQQTHDQIVAAVDSLLLLDNHHYKQQQQQQQSKQQEPEEEQQPFLLDETRVLGFYEPLGTLLRHVYDPQYDHHLAMRQGEILFRGDRTAVLEWAENYISSYSINKKCG